MIDWENIENAIQEWAKANSGLEVIWSNQSAPSPEPPYITLSILNIKKVGGFDETRQTNGEFIKCGLRRLTVSIQVYGRNTVSIMEKLKNSLELSQAEEFLKQFGIAPVSASDINRIPEFIDTLWEDRTHMDAIFHITSNLSQPETFAIERIKAEGTFEGGQTGSHNGSVEV